MAWHDAMGILEGKGISLRMSERDDRTGTVEIDGSEGEGGGQMVRTAVALAALTGRDLRIRNIRSGRPRPGLMNQHLSAIEAVASLCDASLKGAEVGSTEVRFSPGKVVAGDVAVDVGTAGSVSLVLQSCLLAMSKIEGRCTIAVKGGTDVRLAPSISYYELVLFPMLAKAGYEAELTSYQRGFYPEGGGSCLVSWKGNARPNGLDLGLRGGFVVIDGVAYAQNLPDHVPGRMSLESKRALVSHQPVNVRVEGSKGASTGAGIVLSARFENTVIGASCLGERGLSSEKVAKIASDELLGNLRSTSTVDRHACDQILPYLAMSSSPSTFVVDEVTSHLQTQVILVKRFLDVEIDIAGTGPFHVKVRPNRT